MILFRREHPVTIVNGLLYTKKEVLKFGINIVHNFNREASGILIINFRFYLRQVVVNLKSVGKCKRRTPVHYK